MFLWILNRRGNRITQRSCMVLEMTNKSKYVEDRLLEFGKALTSRFLLRTIFSSILDVSDGLLSKVEQSLSQ